MVFHLISQYSLTFLVLLKYNFPLFLPFPFFYMPSDGYDICFFVFHLDTNVLFSLGLGGFLQQNESISYIILA